MKTKSSKTHIIIKILWVLAVLVSIKTVFTDFGGDNAYSMVMSYRHITGDRMFLEMWEPHQTSIFLTDILMWIYGLIVPSFAGVAVYLQICGTLFFVLISVFLFKEIRALSGDTAAHLAAIFFLIFRAKQTVFPEFSNLQIGFSALMFLMLLSFLKDQKRYIKLVISALFLCLEVLSYPSCAAALVSAVIILCLYSEKKLKNSLIFAGTAGAAGVLYVVYFVLRIGPSTFIECLKGVVNSDSHANITYVGGFDYFSGLVTAVIWIAVSAALAAAVYLAVNLCAGKRLNFFGTFGVVFFAGNFLMLLLQKKTGIDWTCSFYIIPLVLIAAGFTNYKNLEAGQKRFFVSGVLVSLASAVAAAALSDLGLITFVSFLALGGAVSFAALKDAGRSTVTGAAFILATVLLSRGFTVWGYANKGNVWNVLEIERYVKQGPTFGILTDYMTSKEAEVNAAEFPEYVREDDRLLVVGDDWLFDPAVYMLSGTEISNYSVIDTPYYNESLEDYFKLNPQKIPTVIAVKCWFGNLYFPEDSYIMKWIDGSYEPVGDASYYRFYRLSDAQGQKK